MVYRCLFLKFWVRFAALGTLFWGGESAKSGSNSGSSTRARTWDKQINSLLLYQLSYRGTEEVHILMARAKPVNRIRHRILQKRPKS